jgi:hypothetical protein
MVCSSGDVLTVYLHHVVLVLLHTVRNHVLDEAVERLNLLVNYSILIKVSIYDFPLIINANLVIAIVLYPWLRKDAANRRINLS